MQPKKERILEIDGERFTVLRRRIKSFNLRLHPDGTVYVSAPLWATDAQIEAFLRPRMDWLRRHRALQAQKPRGEDAPRFGEGDSLWLFGQRYALTLQTPGTPGLSFCGEQAVLCCADTADEAARRALIEQGYRQALGAYLAARTSEFCARMALPLPQISMRLMRSRWGSCTPAAGRIRFNLRLAQKPKPWIDYVIVHELAHLRHPDHSPAFWALVERYIPDWRALRKALNAGDHESL